MDREEEEKTQHMTCFISPGTQQQVNMFITQNISDLSIVIKNSGYLSLSTGARKGHFISQYSKLSQLHWPFISTLSHIQGLTKRKHRK